MNRKERRAAQKRGDFSVSPMAATLVQAFRAHQAGHRSDAERLYRDVLSVEPRNAAALHLLGALMHQTGRSEDAVSLMRQAIAIEPRNPDYHYNLGAVLNAVGRLADAVEPLSKAIALKPQYAEAHLELGHVHAQAGDLDSAEKALRKALELQPGNALILNNLGRVLHTAQRTDEAVALWERAVTRQPDLALAHLNIGKVRNQQGRLAEAETSLRRALEIQADYPEAMQELAAVLVQQDRADDALSLAVKALEKRDGAETKLIFVQCLLAARQLRPDATLNDLLRRAIAEAWVRPAALMPLGAAMLKANLVLGPAIRRVSEQWGKVPAAQLLPTDAEIEAAAQASLLRTMLEAEPVADIELERFLTALRAALLQQAVAGNSVSESVLGLYASLARQCFLNDYVFVESEDERSRVYALQTAIANAIRGNQLLAAVQLVALAAYRPLHALDGSASLLTQSWPDPVVALLRQQVEEPQQEIAIAGEIPALTQVTPPLDEARRSVGPRWSKAQSTLQPQAVADVVRYHLPGVGLPPLAVADAPDVLIAGCGSGLAAVEAALVYRDARVLALDESTSNLAYGRRMAKSMNLTSIEFAQADIAELGSIGRSFDVIEAGASLHHVADPFAAWAKLAALLKSGGIMRISLVSETAHKAVAAARDFVQRGNYQADDEGIRLFRQNLLRLPSDHPALKVTYDADFFATGTCRDLIFAPYHQLLPLPDIQAFLGANGLELIGFETTPEIARAFAARFPDPGARIDLHAWLAFERERADTIAPPYRLWLWKPHANGSASSTA